MGMRGEKMREGGGGKIQQEKSDRIRIGQGRSRLSCKKGS